MAGFVPGLLPTSHTQEMEFAQAYEDVLERYKGNVKAFVGNGRGRFVQTQGETGMNVSSDCFIV